MEMHLLAKIYQSRVGNTDQTRLNTMSMLD